MSDRKRRSLGQGDGVTDLLMYYSILLPILPGEAKVARCAMFCYS